MSNYSDFVTVTSSGRQKGFYVYIDERYKKILENHNIPIDTPIDQLKIKRYYTKNNIILKITVKDDPANL